MRIAKIVKNIRCDTVLCNKCADFELTINSYKGNLYLCEKCYKTIQNLFKRTTSKDG